MSLANPWFRMYAEYYHDPKIQGMSEAMQRRLVMLFCLKCCDVLVTLSDDDVAFALRIDEIELEKTKNLFIGKGFIDKEWNILNWDKRQFVSDKSTERTRAYRDRLKEKQKEQSESSPKRHGDRLDTDTDSDNKNITVEKIRPVEIVFNYWKEILNHPTAGLDKKRKSCITEALKNYSVENLKLAIDGCSKSSWHMGKNDRNKRFDALTLILRDADHIDSFIKCAKGGGGYVAPIPAPLLKKDLKQNPEVMRRALDEAKQLAGVKNGS